MENRRQMTDAYLPHDNTLAHLRIHLNHTPLANTSSLDHGTNLHHDVILQHDALRLARARQRLQSDGAALADDARAAQSHGAIGRDKLGTWMDDGVVADADGLGACQRRRVRHHAGWRERDGRPGRRRRGGGAFGARHGRVDVRQEPHTKVARRR